MVNEKMVYNFAVNSQGFEGSFVDFQNLPADERAEYELGAGAGAGSLKIEFFIIENNMAVWCGEGRVLANNEIVDCPLDFGTHDYENIYENISEKISEGETEGDFANEYEVEYSWEVK